MSQSVQPNETGTQLPGTKLAQAQPYDGKTAPATRRINPGQTVIAVHATGSSGKQSVNIDPRNDG